MIMPEKSLVVEPVPVLGDNYVWMFSVGDDHYVAVDPGESEAVIHWLEERGGRLAAILLTHHHGDHTGGVTGLRERYGAKVVGSERDRGRLPAVDHPVGEGSRWVLGGWTVTVMETPGHTLGHVVYCVGDVLFSGDTLFSLGCGRLFEGTPSMMWDSLNKMRRLPDHTRLCCAHEYTLINHGFALSLEPENPALLALRDRLMTCNDAQQPTLPTMLSEEKSLNPFLRCEEQGFAQRLGLENASPAGRFASLREWRNHY